MKKLSLFSSLLTLISFLIVLAILITRHIIHQQYPMADEAWYLESCLNFFKYAQELTLPQTITESLVYRYWKPTILTTLGNITLLLTDGNIKYAITFTTTSFFTLFFLYSYKILRLYIPHYYSLLGTIFISLQSWIFYHYYGFNTEFLAQSLLAPTIYYYLTSNHFQSPRATYLFSFSASMALLARIFLFSSIFLPLLIFEVLYLLKSSSHSLKITVKQKHVIISFLSAIILLAVFYIPQLNSLLDWATAGTIRIDMPDAEKSKLFAWGNITGIYDLYINKSIIIIFIISIVLLTAFYLKQARPAPSLLKKFSTFYPIALVSLCPIFIGALTNSRDLRYYNISLFAVVILIVIVCSSLIKKLQLKSIKLPIITLYLSIVSWQLVSIITNTFRSNDKTINPTILLTPPTYLSLSIQATNKTDPSVLLLHKINKHRNQKHHTKLGSAGLPLSCMDFSNEARRLNIISMEQSMNIYVQYVYDLNFVEKEKRVFDYIILGPLTFRGSSSVKERFSPEAKEIYQAYKENRLKDLKLELKEVISLPDSTYTYQNQFILMKVL